MMQDRVFFFLILPKMDVSGKQLVQAGKCNIQQIARYLGHQKLVYKNVNVELEY